MKWCRKRSIPTKPLRTTTTYDSTGNYVVTENDESGAQKFYTYDVNGNTTSVTNMHGDEIEYQYDVSGNVTYIGESVTSGPFASSEYSYNGAGYLSAIDHNNFRYSFNYDVFGKLISTAIANTAVSTNTYDNSGRLTKTLYANGDYFEYTYDSYDNVLTVTAHNDNLGDPETNLFAEFIYNKKGMVAKSIDYSSGTTTYYYYDFSGTATREYRQNSNESLSYHIGYDDDGNKVEKTAINGYVKTITTGTDEDGAFIDNDGVRISSKTDDFGRTTETVTKKENLEFKTEYAYADGTSTNSTTNNVSLLTQKLGNSTLVTYEYEYDEDGNISEIYESNGNGNAVLSDEYYYDSLNELEIINDRKNGIYTHYTYDKAGNVTEILKRNYDNNGVPSSLISQDTFEYEQNGWNDRLTKFNNDEISYDLNGNPLLYRDGMQFTWVNGRRLKTILYNGNTYAMSYDTNGMRTQKGNTHYYYDSGNNLVGMTDGTHTLLFYYDENGSPIAFSYNGVIYYYIKNLQGDVMKIVNYNGVTIASYSYDVSGKVLSVKNSMGYDVTNSATHIGNISPFRYRGYVYDFETGLYYLQSRYYDPVTTRFINADELEVLKNNNNLLYSNLFTYCLNDMINKHDDDGYKAKKYHKANMNCYGYALGLDVPAYPGDKRYGTPVDTTFGELLTTIDDEKVYHPDSYAVLSNNRVKLRRLYAVTSRLYEGEYMIAVRVCTVNKNFKQSSKTGENKEYLIDYHFWKQDPKTKRWWNKHGIKGHFQSLNAYNPNYFDDKGWTAIKKGESLEKRIYKKYSNERPYSKTLKGPLYYNSYTEYFACKNEFWSV